MPFSPHQIKAWNATPDKRVIAIVGGTGAGKTWFAPRWVYRRLMMKPGMRMLAIGTGYQRHVKRVMMYEMTKFLTDQPDAPHPKDRGLGMKEGRDFLMNYTDGYLELTANNSQLLFGSSENPLKLEGPHLEGGCWIDEAGMMDRAAWDVAQRRTGMNRAPILITTIPYFENWVKTDVLDPYEKGDKSIEWIQCATKDNPYYSVEEIERMRRTYRPEKFSTFYLGLYGKPHGMIYDLPYEMEKGLAVDQTDEGYPMEDIPPDWPIYAGHDYGWTAPTTGIWGRLSPEGVLYIVKDYEYTEKTIENHIRTWDEEGLTYIDAAWGDSAHPEVWARANDVGYPVLDAIKDIAYGIDITYEMMSTGKLKIFRGCNKLISARRSYRWMTDPKDEEKLLDKPAKPQPAEHIMDALRYLCTGLVDLGIAPEPPAILTRTQYLHS